MSAFRVIYVYIYTYTHTWYDVKLFVRAFRRKVPLTAQLYLSYGSISSFMAGEILSVKRVEPRPSCVRKSTRLCYIFTYEEGGWKERTCLYSTACAECLCQK